MRKYIQSAKQRPRLRSLEEYAINLTPCVIGFLKTNVVMTCLFDEVSLTVIRVAHRLQPASAHAVLGLLHRDMAHDRVRAGAVPMLLAGRYPDPEATVRNEPDPAWRAVTSGVCGYPGAWRPFGRQATAGSNPDTQAEGQQETPAVSGAGEAMSAERPAVRITGP